MSGSVDSSSQSTLVSGATVAADYGLFEADVLIRDGRVVALGASGHLAVAADEVIDATGLVILPGAVDPHAHFGRSRPH